MRSHIQLMKLSTAFTRTVSITALAALICGQLAAQQVTGDTTRPAIVEDTTIIVIKRPTRADSMGVKITGIVLDAATRKPLPGINISIPDFSAAISEEDGRFTIKVPSYSSTLLVSAPGYQSKEAPLRGNATITVQLYDENFDSYYDEAVTPSAVLPRNRITSTFITTNTQGAWMRNQETPENYLQGTANGLSIIRRSGTPNIGSNLFMRGMSSLFATNKPLIVVDGMIYETNDFGGSILNNFYSNPLSLIDIKDIDNITVIKDGSSLYGTKGANGVIMITTAKANNQATKIDLGIYTGMNFAPKQIPVMNAAQYRPYLSDILQSQGMTENQVSKQPYMTDDPTNPQYFPNHYNTNWQDAIFKNSLSQNIYLRVTGGDNIARYALSMGYLKNQGVIKNTDLVRYNTRLNADLNLSKRLLLNSNLSFAYGEQHLQHLGLNSKLNPVFVALVKSPFLPIHEVDKNGDESPNLADVDTLGMSNPATLVQQVLAINKSYRFFGSLNFSYTINNLFTIQSLFGITHDKVRENFFVPRKGISNDTLQAAIADSRSGSQVKRLFAVFNDTRLRYKKTFNLQHDVEILAGVRYQQQSQEQDIGYGYNSATDELVNVGYSIPSLRKVGGDIGKNRWMNTYLNVNYGFNDKLFLTAAVSADGSSRFGSQIPNALTINNNKFSLLPSLHAAWLASSEAFMKKIPVISMLKLRAGYGYTGNDDIGNYTARQSYVSQNLLGMEGLVRGNFANPQLQWEVNKKLDLGIDLGFLHDRLRISADVYQNRTEKMVVLEKAPTASGLDYIASNSGGMKTEGFEANVNGRIINRPLLKWDVSAGIAVYRNHITKLPDDRIITPFADGFILSEVGKAANLFYGHKTHGVYSTDQEAAAAGLSTKPINQPLTPFKGGDMIFEDQNNDKQINEQDMQVIGNPNPDFTGMFSSSLSWRRFSFEALFTFSVGNDVYNYTRAQLESGSNYNNQLPSMVNRWRAQGQITNMPKAAYGDPMGNSRFSDRWIEDGSYLRLRSLSISYNVHIRPAFLKYITVYAAATNLFTITKYLGYDPEFSATESIIGQGVDIGLEPQFRSVQTGVRIGL
ncbi:MULTISPECIES: SusC/RagA family TonB-linked outer membrane protein [Niastella]|uniref:SusC/RagA family TonB-linked outer membrane protein n=1 Tax=Niastella soli TaxID=2821487 RepID=A0ABS3Z0V0_9BACT|nr:SusC/RagA family TonB-linked outer membrane protein [Niastella soli]MBO9203790.1 SusC/RagA family TonB-linked outer membrane protein [Niastella soli]